MHTCSSCAWIGKAPANAGIVSIFSLRCPTRPNAISAKYIVNEVTKICPWVMYYEYYVKLDAWRNLAGLGALYEEKNNAPPKVG